MSKDSAPRPAPVPATAPITIDPYATSKKRNHEEISPEDEPMGANLPPSRTPGISPTAIYGEEIARINPLTGTASTAETQTGTWFEDQLEKKLQPNVGETAVQTKDSDGESPKRKAPRRDASSSAGVAMAANPTNSPTATVAQPTIDQYTHLLGIGWTHVGEDASLIAMARGFTRYIDNHYTLTDPEVLLKSKSLEAYLVKSSQGYFLFSENLKEARLVARTWEDTLANLQSSPVQFSSEQPLSSSRTPDTGREGDNAMGSSAMTTQPEDMDMD